MERPIKGGYILISLGLIALSTSYSGSIDYDKISRTKKHIVLTGIKVGDTVMPDICVKPVYGNGTITFEDVYGFDVVVSSNNSVSVSEHVAPSVGTKLYKHTIVTSSIRFDLYSLDNTPFSSVSITNFSSKSIFSKLADGSIILSFYVDTDDNYTEKVFVVSTGQPEAESALMKSYPLGTFVSDTVTEL